MSNIDISNSNSSNKSTPSPQASCGLSAIDIESNDSSDKVIDRPTSSQHCQQTGVDMMMEDRPSSSSSNSVSIDCSLAKSESVKSMSSLLSEQNAADDVARHELRKLSLDQNGTFMVDFDPEKSQREMRKMNRRICTRESKRNQLYDDKGLLLDTSLDLCDCLDQMCPGCHFPCSRCGSEKCGMDCRCNRKYTVDLIEVEGTETIFTFPT